MTGDELLNVLGALSNPHRLRILAALQKDGRNYVSQMARDHSMSRPLLHLHLQKLEQARLVESHMELSEDGKAFNYYQIRDFALTLDPQTIAEAAATLTAQSKTRD